jgi:hypothetical protein
MTETDHGTEQELERCIEDLLAQKKNDIERSLAEAIDQEKEKARQRTLELEQEFARGREALARHQTMMADVDTATGGVRERIGKHLEQAGHCRIMVRRLADKIGEECRNADELGREIDDIVRKAGEESVRLRSELESRYGLSVPPVETMIQSGIGNDLEEALKKLSRYREGLMALDADERFAGAPPAPGGGENGVDTEAVSRALELRLTTETLPEVGAFRVYRNGDYAVLDGGSVLEEAGRFIGEARILQERLAGTKSAKEQYYVKRDLLGLQESLRKLVAKAVEICEADTCDLPLPTADILNIPTLADIREILNTGNWSDPSDLDSFEGRIEALRSALSPRQADTGTYGKAILEQLHEAV